MSGFLRNIVLAKTFDGDEVSMVLTPLTLEEVLMTSALSKGPDQNPSTSDVAKVVTPIVQKHLVSVTGLRAADGTEVTIQELLANAYFTRLVVDAGMELLSHAYPRNPNTSAS